MGWHIAAGSTEEYIRPVLHPLQFLDYSQPSLSAYRRWLQNKYSSVQVLNTSWKSEYVDFTDIPMPSLAERAYPMCGSLRDPDKEKHVLDFYEFYGDELAFFVWRLCMEGKRITDGKKLMGVFYGNISICTTELSHNSMNLLLQCDEIDFFASPFCYTDNRGPAHDWPFQATLESAHLHGKPWFVEADVRTFLSRPISQCMPYANPEVNKAYDGPVWLGPETVEGSLGDMLKAFSRILTHNAALWWFDMWGGWYDHEALMDFHRWAYPFYENIVHNGRATPRAQLAVFIDEKALSGFSPRDSMAHAVCYQQIVELGWLGAPYDCYLLSDFKAVDPTRYRMAMLLSPAGLTEGQRKHLAYWKKDGRTVLFTGYTSYFFGHMGEETDIAYEMSDSIVVLRANYGSEVYPEGTVSGPAIRLHPDAGDVPLSFDETENPMAMLHRSSDYQTVWSIVPQVPCSIVRDMMLLSGAHIYCHSRDNVYAGGDLVIIHACSKGVKRIFLPSIGKAYDVFTGERLPGTELWVEIEMQVGQTCMLRLELTPKK